MKLEDIQGYNECIEEILLYESIEEDELKNMCKYIEGAMILYGLNIEKEKWLEVLCLAVENYTSTDYSFAAETRNITVENAVETALKKVINNENNKVSL